MDWQHFTPDRPCDGTLTYRAVYGLDVKLTVWIEENIMIVYNGINKDGSFIDCGLYSVNKPYGCTLDVWQEFMVECALLGG